MFSRNSGVVARSAGSLSLTIRIPGVPLRFTPGRGPQPSISAGVEVSMLPCAPRTKNHQVS